MKNLALFISCLGFKDHLFSVLIKFTVILVSMICEEQKMKWFEGTEKLNFFCGHLRKKIRQTAHVIECIAKLLRFYSKIFKINIK